MISAEKFTRLNNLARKKKAMGLTQSEAKEQHLLQQEYLTAFRKNTRETIENMTVIDIQGNDVTPEKIKALRAEKDIH